MVPFYWLFWLVVALCAIPLLLRLWQLSPLYLHADLRADAKEAMLRLEREKGWLLSDVSVRSISKDSMHITYAPHIRGRDPSHCYVVDLPSSALHPCDGAH